MPAQIVDLYTYIVGSVSPGTVGNDGGTFLVRGPSGRGADRSVDGVFECPTVLCLALVRTSCSVTTTVMCWAAVRCRPWCGTPTAD